MRRVLLTLLFVCFCTIGWTEGPQYFGEMTGKIVSQVNNNGYFVLSDGSCWKAIFFVKRWRTPGEWIKGVDLFVPENYETKPCDWTLGTGVDVYLKSSYLNVDESFASNCEDLKKCTHLLYNKATGAMLFAIGMHPVDCMNELFTEGYDVGHSKGYSTGYSTGYSSGYAAAKLKYEHVENRN